jgi:hypothetical protein
MKKALPILILLLLVAMGIRLYPTLISGMPFSTDAWPLIRNTKILLQNTPLPLNSNLFDGYNNFWPLSSVFGAVFSEITTLPAETALALGIPIAAALAIPIFYMITKKITQSTKMSLIATALLATAFPYALFTAGVTKETFASPIYLALILVFLLKHNWKTVALFSVLSVALVMAHHLTSFIAIGVIATLCVASFISKNKTEKVNSGTSNFVLLAILSAVTAAYFLLYAGSAFIITLTSSDLLTVGAYQILIAALMVYVAFSAKNFSRKITILNAAVGFAAAFLFILLLTQVPLMSTAPLLPTYYLLYALPFIIAVPMIIFGLNELYQKNSKLITPLFWITSIIAFACYAVFANPVSGVSYVARSINFMLPPFLILVAIGVTKLFDLAKPFRTRKIIKFAAVAIILSMAALNTYTVYATVSLQEPYLGYFWRYEPSEYRASSWLATNIVNQSVAGDSKANYLVHGYFGLNVSVTAGLSYLAGDGSPPKVLYIYNQMKTNGYVLYQGIPVTLPSNWTDKLAPYDCVYTNNEVTIYARR